MNTPIEHLARLARLSVSEQEKATFSTQIDSIIAYFEKLNELDVRDVEPTSHVVSLKNVVRDDVLGQSLQRDEALGNAPDRTGIFYRVPKIIE